MDETADGSHYKLSTHHLSQNKNQKMDCFNPVGFRLPTPASIFKVIYIHHLKPSPPFFFTYERLTNQPTVTNPQIGVCK